MLRNFKLKVDNFGPINKADLDISKINIIAGKNASGKTALSKLIYCFITAFSPDGEYLEYEFMKNELESLIETLKIFHSESINITDLDMIKMSINLGRNKDLKTIEKGYGDFESIINALEFDKKILLGTIERDRIRLQNFRKIYFYCRSLSTLIINEFAGGDQLLTNFNGSEILFYNHDCKNPFGYTVKIDRGIFVDSEFEFEKITTTKGNAIYIETSYFPDYKIPLPQFKRYGKKQFHRGLLHRKLTDQYGRDDIPDPDKNKAIIKFQNKIENLTGGKFVFNVDYSYDFYRNGEKFVLSNVSAGIRSLEALWLLLENRKLKENTYLIMDEPEAHLHPEWQVKLAEILILMVKELNVNLFINSHSPQFIEAIEVYSVKYGLRNETNFYLTKKDEDSEKYNVKKIGYNNLYELYNDLGDPYDEIDKVRGQNLARHL